MCMGTAVEGNQVARVPLPPTVTSRRALVTRWAGWPQESRVLQKKHQLYTIHHCVETVLISPKLDSFRSNFYNTSPPRSSRPGIVSTARPNCHWPLDSHPWWWQCHFLEGYAVSDCNPWIVLGSGRPVYFHYLFIKRKCTWIAVKEKYN